MIMNILENEMLILKKLDYLTKLIESVTSLSNVSSDKDVSKLKVEVKNVKNYNKGKKIA